MKRTVFEFKKKDYCILHDHRETLTLNFFKWIKASCIKFSILFLLFQLLLFFFNLFNLSFIVAESNTVFPLLIVDSQYSNSVHRRL